MAEGVVDFTWTEDGGLKTGTITISASGHVDLDDAVNLVMAGLQESGEPEYTVTRTRVSELAEREPRTKRKPATDRERLERAGRAPAQPAPVPAGPFGGAKFPDPPAVVADTPGGTK
jgi:hypothetical protein